MNRTTLAAVAAAAAVAGCAAPRPNHLVWQPTRADVMPLDQAQAKCAYEAAAATQNLDYGYRSAAGREMDRNNRRGELVALCMRAQGYGLGLPPHPDDAKWRALEGEWEAARRERAEIRQKLSESPRSPQAAQYSEQIRALNLRVRDLERQLSYNPSEAVSTDPFSDQGMANR